MSNENDDWEDKLTVNKHKVVERYLTWLDRDYPRKAKEWRSRRESQPQPLAAEAVVWETLQKGFNAEPRVADEKGGADFLCKIDGHSFFVEVASLDADSAAERTNLPNDWEPGTWMFGLDHVKVRDLITKKRDQLGGQPHPVVLAACSEHVRSGTLFGDLGTRNMMFGTLGVSVTLGQANATPRDTSNFEHSLWLRTKSDRSGLEIWRGYPSAVLLVSIYDRACELNGMLHPAPELVFPYQLLPGVPFRRFTTWPPKGNTLELEWVTEEPPVKRVGYLVDFDD